MSGFTNLSILECNRLSSEEAKSGNDSNPALFTNKLGTGVELNIGDTIEVSSVFISEQGAGDQDTIEFKGKSLNKQKQINFLNPTFTEKYSIYQAPLGYSKITWNASTPNVDLFDNKASVVINYFKNANGENYYQLPRKYLAYLGNSTAPFNDGSVNASGTLNLFFAQEDSISQGNASFAKGALPFHQVPFFVSTDADLYYATCDYYYVSGAMYDDYTENQATSDYYKIRNDNSRYTIYVAKENYYISQFDETGNPKSVENPAPNDYWINELSQRVYLRYSERIDLQVNAGFNSAENVADDLTNQLSATGEVQTIEYPPFSDAEPYFSPSQPLTTFLESPTYKTFQATNTSLVSSAGYVEFNASHTNQAPSQAIVDYINQTNYIGIKRPDLYDKGYLLSTGLKDSLGSLLTLPSLTHNYTAGDTLIRTNIGWRSDNLELLKALFDEEAKHPELFENAYNSYGRQAFDGTGTNTTNSRFLHINSRNFFTGTTPVGQLGTDDVNGTGSYKDFSTDNFISLPLFIFFDNSRKDLAEGGNNENDLYYGFAQRDSTNKHLMSFFVGGNASHCPPPDRYLQYNNNKPAGTSIGSGTVLGWDTHFTAYSTCAIALTNGWVQEMWNGGEKNPAYWNVGVNTTWDTNTAVAPNASTSREISPLNQLLYVSKIYLGSQQPLIEFNASSNRFAISQLHTAEYEGNIGNAGGTNASTTIELNPNAERKVYKINKRNNCFSFSTALIPYTATDVPSASDTETFSLSLPNINLEKYTIFDSQSGIIIKDFGFNETDWKEGLWGIMGFTYEQFNASETFNNDITERITERNASSLPYAFTNANVSASDTIDFIVNGWGTPMYNAMIPTTFIWNGSGQTGAEQRTGHRTGFKIENPPAITKAQTSIELVARNLPRRMLRPYYCIRSNILADSYYLGGADSGQALPVVAVVNKIDGYGDFYFGTPSDFVFTNNRKRVLTNIITSIHSPDQTYARVDLDSAVIYKITKQIKAQTNVVEELLQQKVLTKEQLEELM